MFAGLEQVVEYVENLHFGNADIDYFRSLGLFSDEFLKYLKEFRFTGDIYAFPEGTVMYPNEPVITIVAPLIDAQLIETAVLTQVNRQSFFSICISSGKTSSRNPLKTGCLRKSKVFGIYSTTQT